MNAARASVVIAGSVAAVAATLLALGLEAETHTAVARPAPPLVSAGLFVTADIREKAEGRWALAWQSLYPAHRRVAPEAVYVRCERSTPFTAPLRSLRVRGVRRALVHVAGLARSLPGAAVTIGFAVAAGYGPRDPVTFSHTFHVVPVDGAWRWLLSPERYRLYVRGECGANT